ncbi:trehalose-phosphatase [Streptomyces sp. SID3343]|uniref:trehalose-phosphatase n=1 Tax=Streptomyces sp. SID3343 TaxID=2690260 RepID=UPI001371148F|nr:trehalose-phosphatase [Streptomyces sp. SID3343]MYW03714.1 trehalose-phosphatase [Streptomyces sp. SID3343]
MPTNRTALPEPVTSAGRAGLAALLAQPQRAVVALDFDGTLAPIVDDPDQARADVRAVRALSRLTPRLDAVVIVTGRPAAVAVEYGRFRGVEGLEHLVVLGHYGLERWDARTDRVTAPEPPSGVHEVRLALPGLLRSLGAWDGTWTEDKGSALAVHTRRAPDPQGTFDLLRAPLDDLAAQHGLTVEPGRMVLELRPEGMDKGRALTGFLKERQAASVLFAGDDLGDLAAFGAVEELRGRGVAGITVCSGSAEVDALAKRADLVVPGPAGVADLLAGLADHLTGDRPQH